MSRASDVAASFTFCFSAIHVFFSPFLGDVYPGCYKHCYWVYVGEQRKPTSTANLDDVGDEPGAADTDASQLGDDLNKKSSLEEISSDTKTIGILYSLDPK